MPIVFERPIPAGWLYPCTTDDIREQLSRFPIRDPEGLRAVGLVPSTRRDCSLYGRYITGTKPVIHIRSLDQSLAFKQSPHAERGNLEHRLSVELLFGMTLERSGSRWISRWKAADWRRFVLEHVLPHEVGHHVQLQQRLRDDHCGSIQRSTEEQFAEAYACRHWRSHLTR
ncbi:MAG: hypothetical protein M3Y56_11130 [Armatimonadota bacterium]|nr:hypothetical protein [Armatimonadota bacterium]